MAKPHKSLLDPTFKYTKSVATDLRETFKRVRREQAREKAEQAQEPNRVVTMMRKT